MAAPPSGPARASGGRDLLRGFVPVLAAGAVVFTQLTDPGDRRSVTFLTLSFVLFGVWAFWPRIPVALLVAGVVPLVVLAKLGGQLDGALFLVALLAIVVAGWECPRWVLAAAGLVVLGTPTVVVLLNPGDVDVGIWTFAVAFPGLISWLFRRQEVLTAQLEAARRELERQAESEERRRIARDVHDAVGHGLAAVMLQVAGARHVLRRDPDEADVALAAAEDAGRRSLAELRGSVGSLRGEQHDPRAAPPGLDGLGGLVEDARAGGLDVEFTTTGRHHRVGPAVSVAAYRIAQEALVNAARHAPAARTVVASRVADGQVELRVHSIGPIGANGTSLSRPGYGLVGMGERAKVAGGILHAGPAPDGWLVRFAAPAGQEAAADLPADSVP
jgi:signal transduction histidine kinase